MLPESGVHGVGEVVLREGDFPPLPLADLQSDIEALAAAEVDARRRTYGRYASRVVAISPSAPGTNGSPRSTNAAPRLAVQTSWNARIRGADS
jgi:hypothetical protein